METYHKSIRNYGHISSRCGFIITSETTDHKYTHLWDKASCPECLQYRKEKPTVIHKQRVTSENCLGYNYSVRGRALCGNRGSLLYKYNWTYVNCKKCLKERVV